MKRRIILLLVMPRGVPREFHTPAYRKFSLALRDIRREAGLTQVQLAALLKQPQAYVSKIEVGERRVDVLEWLAICRVCRIAPPEFLEKFYALLDRVRQTDEESTSQED